MSLETINSLEELGHDTLEQPIWRSTKKKKKSSTDLTTYIRLPKRGVERRVDLSVWEEVYKDLILQPTVNTPYTTF